MVKGKNKLIASFTEAGVRYAADLRRLLPEAVLGEPAKAARAKSALKRSAKTASDTMTAGARAWLASGDLERAVEVGQKAAARQVSIAFGGVNQALADRLKLQIAQDLGRAAASPEGFLNTTLRRATAIAKKTLDANQYTPLVNADSRITTSLLSSTLNQTAYNKAVRAMLDELGLDKGDRVLFLSGYRMEASAYAKTVVRTRTMEALNTAKAAELTDNGFLYVETSEHEGVDPKDICFALQGRVWALAPNPLGIPILPPEYGLPPWHPNCAHTFAAWQPKFEGGDKAVDKVLDDHSNDQEELAKWRGADGTAKAYQPAQKEET